MLVVLPETKASALGVSWLICSPRARFMTKSFECVRFVVSSDMFACHDNRHTIHGILVILIYYNQPLSFPICAAAVSEISVSEADNAYSRSVRTICRIYN